MKERPTRYRKRTPVAPTSPLVGQQPSTSSDEMPSSSARGFDDYARIMTNRMTAPVSQTQRPRSVSLSSVPYSAGFDASQLNLNDPFVGTRDTQYSYGIAGGFSPLSPANRVTFPQAPGNQNAVYPISILWSPSFNTGQPTSPLPNMPLHTNFETRWPTMPLQHLPSQHAQLRPTGYTYHGNDRTTLPSQQLSHSLLNYQNMPSRHGSGPRMINIPPPVNYPTVDGVARPPTPYTNQDASMPMPPLVGFGMPGRKDFSENKTFESISIPDSSIGGMSSHGHRRNKTTISKIEDIGEWKAPAKNTRQGASELCAVGHQFGAKSSVSGHKTLPAFSFGAVPMNFVNNVKGVKGANNSILAPQKIDQKLPRHAVLDNKRRAAPTSAKSSTNPSYGSSHMLRRRHSLSNLKKPIVSMSHAHEYKMSNDSNSTVASDSWSTFSSEITSPKKEVGLKFDLHTGLTTQVDAMSLKKNNAGFDLRKSPAGMTSTEARHIYPLDAFVSAGREHGVNTFDFAYASGTPPSKKHVRFASRSDHAPSLHFSSSSNDSTASTRVLIDLDEYDERMADGRKIRAISTANGKEEDEMTILPATTYKPPKKQLIAETENGLIIRETPTNDPSMKYQNNYIDTNADGKFPNSNGANEFLKQGEHQLPPKQHKRSSFFRRASDSLHKFAAAHAGMTPVRDDGDILNRGPQPSTRAVEQRVSSMPILRPNEDEGNRPKRRSSFGRILERFGGK
ncbi:Nn.00g075720.m01.CDS01 [Neocucurbitaria sp. VM-36]